MNKIILWLVIVCLPGALGGIIPAGAAAVIQPQALTHFTVDNPAANRPVIKWTPIPDAVMYEVELLSAKPENPNGIEPSVFRFFATQQVYGASYQADLTNYDGSLIYWRVRALDFHHQPVGVFSAAEPLVINHQTVSVLKPDSDNLFNVGGMATPLYPVYEWTRIPGAAAYEVELTDQLPENPNGTEPSRYRIWSNRVGAVFDCYDDEARRTPGTYYWRVRGLDEAGNAVGVYSDARKFVVDRQAGSYAAAYGDSIVHGGGSVSYSPVDWDYDFETYLAFANVNLGRSGDTTEDMVNRFEADVLPFSPRFLLILGGTNSLRGGTPARQVIAELEQVRDKCLANNIRPIFLTLPSINPAAIAEVFNEPTVADWREQFTAVNEFIRRQPYYIDLEPYFIDEQGIIRYEYALDGLHPGLKGKKLMADIINQNWDRVTQ